VLNVEIKGFSEQGIQLYLKVKQRGTPILLARAGTATGPIIGFREIDEFTIESGLKGGFLFTTDSDGFGHGIFSLSMKPKIHYLTISVHFFVPTMSIEGQSKYTFSASQLAPEGNWSKPFLMIPGSDKTCHKIIVTED
jgi:hypothetical protein